MQGSKNSAMLFLMAAISLIVQTIISAAVFDDWVGSMVAGTFTFVMIITTAMAYKGGLSAVMDTTVVETPNYDGTSTRTTYYRDTGQRIQMTPCCGLLGGIATIVVTFMFAADLGDMIVLLAPGFIGGALAILGAIVFTVEYKGPWTGTEY